MEKKKIKLQLVLWLKVIISFNEFEYEIKSWIIFTDTVKVSIAPNMLTLLISFLFFSSIWVRNEMNYNINKKIEYIMLILGNLFFASFISVLVSNEYFYIPLIGETNYTAQSLCIVLLAISWVGIKFISMITIPIMAFLSVGRIGEVNKAMWIVGIIYLLFAYLAIFLVFNNNKIRTKIKNSFGEFKKDFFFPNDNSEEHNEEHNKENDDENNEENTLLNNDNKKKKILN